MLRKITFQLVVFCLIIFQSCQTNPGFPELELIPIKLETHSSGSSRLSADQEGKAYISWIEYIEDDRFQLQYAKLEKEQWTLPSKIAEGDNWFVNWADFPSLYPFNNGHLAGHWLEMRGDGTYEYDVQVSLSKDGKFWSSPIIPHRDSIAAEHGFVSMLPSQNDHMMLSWLDGRKTVIESANYGDQHHGHHGSMTLRCATMNTEGLLSDEFELDERVCDCCQTDMAMSASGPLIVYRDRTEEEIRDISIVRIVDGRPTPPKPIYNDEWKINACPVNGPAIGAKDSLVIVTWFTAANGQSKVQTALSTDNGQNFGLPLRIDAGLPYGRVDCTWINEEIGIVTWLEDVDDEAWICARIINGDGSKSKVHQLVKTHHGRNSGFPTIVQDEGGILLSWTEIKNGDSQVRTGRILFK